MMFSFEGADPTEYLEPKAKAKGKSPEAERKKDELLWEAAVR